VKINNFPVDRFRVIWYNPTSFRGGAVWPGKEKAPRKKRLKKVLDEVRWFVYDAKSVAGKQEAAANLVFEN